jgi:transcription-repair coupling factor (superfamily II helicase)
MSNNLQHGILRLDGAPEGQDARVLAELAIAAWETLRAPILHIVRDDTRLYTLKELYAYFAPEIKLVSIPGWDCLPYDRVSPNQDVIAERVKSFVDLAPQEWTGPTIIMAPVNAVTQRIPSLDNFIQADFILKTGSTINRDKLQKFLIDQGYTRSDTVREPGEYAIRGSIIDLFPAGFENPVRLDCFDDDIETIKSFDPIEQTSIETRDVVSLTPMSEIILSQENITHFRAKYRELFGAQTSNDPLFEAISEGHRYPGMEHWLPLFYKKTQTIFECVPERSPLVFDPQIEAVYHERMGQVIDFYNARIQVADSKNKATANSYKAIAPSLLYLLESDWQNETKKPIRRILSPFPGDGEGGIDCGAKQAPNLAAQLEASYEALKANLLQCAAQKKKVILACYSEGSLARVKQLCIDHHIPTNKIEFILLSLEHGFVAPDLALVTEQDFLGDRLTRAVKRRRRRENALTNVSDLNIGDLIVHMEHGVGKFDGLITLEVDGVAHDCVRIIYADNDKLFIPVESLDVLSRFGSDMNTTQLDRLGGAGWQARKARVKKRLLEMAEGLIEIAAKRKTAEGPEISIPEGSYHEFIARFPYQETEDQERSIADVLNDLHNGHVMDRLVCGDVGFGKTEVAMRAAFVAAMAGLQVAVVVPTTLLARQHYANFVKRFKGFPLKIGQLSRMVTAKEANTTRELLTNGQVDIVIGTHSILSKTVKFQNLGLMIIDEEQNFGVKQKEQLKALRENVHVLTLTATPIPRTLQLAMTGIRDLSLIATPPVDRLAVRTSVMPFDPVIIREAILREYYRGGQCFYVCPRLSDLEDAQKMLAELVPEIRTVQAHGQMSPTELDERMTAFYDGQYHLLLATNIIESGLDIPNANTLIVHRSDMFGLSQLYQIRGRIGRSKTRGYAYFTYKDDKLLTETAKQRLHVISTLDTLGAGFQLASYDMDIRGAGNLLGEEQSGHIKEVGVELYQQMLEEAVQAVRSGQGIETAFDNDWTPTINLGMPVLIPEKYIPDLPVRLSLYRRLASMTEQEDIDRIAIEMVDRFGQMPEEVKNLLHIITIKQLCKKAGIEKIEAGPKGAVVTFRKNQFNAVEKLIQYVHKQMGTVKLRPDQKLTYLRAWDDVAIRMKGVQSLAQDLAQMAA